MAPLANLLTQTPGLSGIASAAAGFKGRRPPSMDGGSFVRWFEQRTGSPAGSGARRIVLWPDTLNNYFRPGAAQAAPVAPPTPGFPRGYQLQVSTNGTSWTEVATGQGSAPTTVIPIQPVQARFVRITQTAAGAADAPAWSIQRARLYSVAR